MLTKSEPEPQQRNKMAVEQGGQDVTDAIIQEGVYTFERSEEKAAEPVVYMIDHYVIGGFYRVHGARAADENLNAPGSASSPWRCEVLQPPGLLARRRIAAQPLLRLRRGGTPGPAGGGARNRAGQTEGQPATASGWKPAACRDRDLNAPGLFNHDPLSGAPSSPTRTPAGPDAGGAGARPDPVLFPASRPTCGCATAGFGRARPLTVFRR